MLNFIKKIIKKISSLFKKDNDCKEDEYCPIYLSYLGKYGKDSKKIKKCKNKYTHYCQKYNLIDKDKWYSISNEEKIKLLKEINFQEFLKINKN